MACEHFHTITPNMHLLCVNKVYMFLLMDICIFSKHNLPLILGKTKLKKRFCFCFFFFSSQSPKDSLAFLLGLIYSTMEASLRMLISWLSKISRDGGRICVKAMKKGVRYVWGAERSPVWMGESPVWIDINLISIGSC